MQTLKPDMSALEQHNFLKQYMERTEFRGLNHIEITENVVLFSDINTGTPAIGIWEKREKGSFDEPDHLIDFMYKEDKELYIVLNNKKAEFTMTPEFQIINHIFTTNEIATIYKSLDYIVKAIFDSTKDKNRRLNRILDGKVQEINYED